MYSTLERELQNYSMEGYYVDLTDTITTHLQRYYYNDTHRDLVITQLRILSQVQEWRSFLFSKYNHIRANYWRCYHFGELTISQLTRRRSGFEELILHAVLRAMSPYHRRRIRRKYTCYDIYREISLILAHYIRKNDL